MKEHIAVAHAQPTVFVVNFLDSDVAAMQKVVSSRNPLRALSLEMLPGECPAVSSPGVVCGRIPRYVLPSYLGHTWLVHEYKTIRRFSRSSTGAPENLSSLTAWRHLATQIPSPFPR